MKEHWLLPDICAGDPFHQIVCSRQYPESFFRAGIGDLPPESLFRDMDVASQRILLALKRKERIVIFGDDDPDGITSTYLLFRFLEKSGSQNHYYYLPNRLTDHHGMQTEFFEFVKGNRFTLAITVDNGVSDFDGIKALNELGCDTIITDHHLVPEKLPDAFAIINPKQPNCRYPFDMLAGAGVVLMLIRHLSGILNIPEDLTDFFWAAVGTIADKAPLESVNRIICRHVFDTWSKINDTNLQVLMTQQPVNGSKVSLANFIGYVTRLLSSGRMPLGENLAIRFLLSAKFEKGEILQQLIQNKNTFDAGANEIISFCDNLDIEEDAFCFVYFDEEGFIPISGIGMAASYLASKYRFPVAILKRKGDSVVCEARSVGDFNLVEAFRHCSGHLVQFGGHAKAAGFSIKEANVGAFRDCFVNYALGFRDSLMEPHSIRVDAVLESRELTREMLTRLEPLLPFGQRNPEPVFMVTGFTADDVFQWPFPFPFGFQPLVGKKYNLVIQLKNNNFVNLLDHEEVTDDPCIRG